LDDCGDAADNVFVQCNETQGISAHCDGKVVGSPYNTPCRWLALNGASADYVRAAYPVTLSVTVHGVAAHRTFDALHRCSAPVNEVAIIVIAALVMFVLYLALMFACVVYKGPGGGDNNNDD